MNVVLSWATILSPIVGLIAIIVALIIAHRSSNETKKQLDAIHNLLDVFVAAQNPTMMEVKRKYEQDLSELDAQIKELMEKIETDNFPPQWSAPLHMADVMFDKNKQCEQLEALENKRNEIEEYLGLIRSYVEKSKN